MCKPKSGFAAFINDDVRLWTSETTDSHAEIAAEHGLRDSGIVGIVAWECYPEAESTADTTTWTYRLDSDATASFARHGDYDADALARIESAVRRHCARYIARDGDEIRAGWRVVFVGRVVAQGSSRVVARSSSRVVAWGSSGVVAWDSSSVEAWGSSRVEARDSSRVVARDSSRVVAWDSSSVEAWGSSGVEARGSSRVVARDSSGVVAQDSSHVVARSSSRVVAWDSSRVEARDNSRVVARDSSVVVHKE